MRIVFMGSPEFAIPTLSTLIDSKHEVVACFTQAAKPKNRGKKAKATPVEELARQHNITVYTPKTLRDDEIVKTIQDLHVDFIVVVAYGLILPENILSLAKYSALNLHPSDLPQFRGAAPLQRTIMSGAIESKICIIKMLAALDAGPIYTAQELNVAKLNYGEFHDLAANIGAKLMLEVINDFSCLKPVSQTSHNISYAHKISKTEALIDFTQNGTDILNLIRALSPVPGAYFLHKELRLKIFSAEFEITTHNEQIGKVNDDFSIYCKDGLIKPKIIQKPGKKPVPIAEFLHGNQKQNHQA